VMVCPGGFGRAPGAGRDSARLAAGAPAAADGDGGGAADWTTAAAGGRAAAIAGGRGSCAARLSFGGVTTTSGTRTEPGGAAAGVGAALSARPARWARPRPVRWARPEPEPIDWRQALAPPWIPLVAETTLAFAPAREQARRPRAAGQKAVLADGRVAGHAPGGTPALLAGELRST